MPGDVPSSITLDHGDFLLMDQLGQTVGTSRTIPGTMGLWALVVDAAPHDVKDMSEGSLASMIKFSEMEEAAYDEDFLLVRAVTTGWKYCECTGHR